MLAARAAVSFGSGDAPKGQFRAPSRAGVAFPSPGWVPSTPGGPRGCEPGLRRLGGEMLGPRSPPWGELPPLRGFTALFRHPVFLRQWGRCPERSPHPGTPAVPQRVVVPHQAGALGGGQQRPVEEEAEAGPPAEAEAVADEAEEVGDEAHLAGLQQQPAQRAARAARRRVVEQQPQPHGAAGRRHLGGGGGGGGRGRDGATHGRKRAGGARGLATPPCGRGGGWSPRTWQRGRGGGSCWRDGDRAAPAAAGGAGGTGRRYGPGARRDTGLLCPAAVPGQRRSGGLWARRVPWPLPGRAWWGAGGFRASRGGDRAGRGGQKRRRERVGVRPVGGPRWPQPGLWPCVCRGLSWLSWPWDRSSQPEPQGIFLEQEIQVPAP